MKQEEADAIMEASKAEWVSVECECCGYKEDCTPEYIDDVKANFDGKWLCGLCLEAVIEEVSSQGTTTETTETSEKTAVEEAIKVHMSCCGKFEENPPAMQVKEGTKKKLLRRRSFGDSSSSSSPSSAPPASKKSVTSDNNKL